MENNQMRPLLSLITLESALFYLSMMLRFKLILLFLSVSRFKYSLIPLKFGPLCQVATYLLVMIRGSRYYFFSITIIDGLWSPFRFYRPLPTNVLLSLEMSAIYRCYKDFTSLIFCSGFCYRWLCTLVGGNWKASCLQLTYLGLSTFLSSQTVFTNSLLLFQRKEMLGSGLSKEASCLSFLKKLLAQEMAAFPFCLSRGVVYIVYLWPWRGFSKVFMQILGALTEKVLGETEVFSLSLPTKLVFRSGTTLRWAGALISLLFRVILTLSLGEMLLYFKPCGSRVETDSMRNDFIGLQAWTGDFAGIAFSTAGEWKQMFLTLSLDLVLMSGVLKSLPSAVSLLFMMKEGSPMLFLIIFRARSMLLLILFPWQTLDESILLFLESLWRCLFLELLSACVCASRTEILLVLIG